MNNDQPQPAERPAGSENARGVADEELAAMAEQQLDELQEDAPDQSKTSPEIVARNEAAVIEAAEEELEESRRKLAAQGVPDVVVETAQQLVAGLRPPEGEDMRVANG
jgi:hypothetical protein